MRVLPQEGQHMTEVHDPGAERDNEPTAGPAAVAAAVRAEATNVMTQASSPIAQVVSDNIRSISATALQNFPGAGVADAIGVSSAIQDSLRHLHPIDGGLTSSARTAMEAVSRGTVASIKSPFSGLSPEIIVGHLHRLLQRQQRLLLEAKLGVGAQPGHGAVLGQRERP